MDNDEEFFEAEVRETKEESEIDKEDIEPKSDFHVDLKYQAWGQPKIVRYFLAKLKNPDQKIVLSHEHKAFKWFNELEAKKVVVQFPDLVKAIDAACSFIKEKDENK